MPLCWRTSTVSVTLRSSAGHSVTLFEKNHKIGGLLRYGIPDFKMEKYLIDRRVAQMAAEGVVMRTGVNVGVDISFDRMVDEFDAVVMSGGAEKPRDLPVPGRELDGIHFAMDFLTQQNRRNSSEPLRVNHEISANGKDVVVIGGGDTGSDCVGTSFRQGAKSVTQIELLPMPPEHENKGLTWPDWPLKLRTSSSHEEGANRDWAITTRKVLARDGKVAGLDTVRVDWVKDPATGAMKMVEQAGTDVTIKAELVLLAMGFVHPVHEGMVEQAQVELDPRGNVRAGTDDYSTTRAKVFAAGDMRRGQSLVVWAIREGRQCARAVDEFLMGYTLLPR